MPDGPSLESQARERTPEERTPDYKQNLALNYQNTLDHARFILLSIRNGDYLICLKLAGILKGNCNGVLMVILDNSAFTRMVFSAQMMYWVLPGKSCSPTFSKLL